jgi:multicomponent Na+:H+ antiporter subunit E
MLLWWVLAGDTAWLFGLPVVALAVGASMALQPTRHLHIRPLGLLRFLAFFALRSSRAGFDVARRALSPGLPIAPAIVDHRLRLRSGAARVFLADTMSLLPGTLTAALAGDRLRLHVLDTGLPHEQELRAAEAAVAALFGEALKDAAAEC